MNILVLSYQDPDFQILNKHTINYINALIKRKGIFITLINIYQQNLSFETKDIDKKIEIKSIAFTRKNNQLSFIESFFEPENKTKFISYLEEILIEKTFDIIQLDSIIFSVFMPNILSLSRNSIIVYRQYIDEVKKIPILYQNYKLQIFKNISTRKLTTRIKNLLELNIKKLDYVVTSVPEAISLYNYPQNYFILPTDISNIQTKKTQSQFTHKIFFAGPLYLTETQRSILWFINETWERLLKEIPNLELHLYGESEKWFTDIIAKKDKVFYHSPDIDIDEFLTDKTILIIPYSRPMGIFKEFIYAIKAKKIIVAHAEAVHGWGLTAMINFMPARTAEQFIEAILHIYEKNEIQEYFSKQISKFAHEKLNNEYLTNIIINFYNRIIKNDKNYDQE